MELDLDATVLAPALGVVVVVAPVRSDEMGRPEPARVDVSLQARVVLLEDPADRVARLQLGVASAVAPAPSEVRLADANAGSPGDRESVTGTNVGDAGC
ncbi:MAG TPA: hypothetical protein VGF91_16665 [Solirubrobacteraceae bacterium]|jgi:hypothetical protein